MSSLRNLRVGIVTWDYPPSRGGLGLAMQWIAKALQEEGMQVRVLHKQNAPWRFSTFTAHGGHHVFSLLLPWFLQRWVDKEHIDVLLVPTGPGGVWLKKMPNHCSTVGISFHTFHQQSSLVPGESWKRIFIRLEKRTLQECHAVYCYAKDTKKNLMQHYGIEEEKLELLPCIFDIQDWLHVPAQKHHALRVVFVGRMEKRKGIYTLLNAWKEVERHDAKAELLLIGKGNVPLQSLRRVKHIPTISREELRTLVAESAVLACPSYLEGFGLAIAEAMATGTPIVAADTDGIRNLLQHERTGTLVPVGNVAAWGGALRMALAHPEHGQEMAKRAKAYILEQCNPQLAKEALRKSILSVYTGNAYDG